MSALFPVVEEILKDSLIARVVVIVDQPAVTVELTHTGIAVGIRINQAKPVFQA